jgi:hypothetical protein
LLFLKSIFQILLKVGELDPLLLKHGGCHFNFAAKNDKSFYINVLEDDCGKGTNPRPTQCDINRKNFILSAFFDMRRLIALATCEIPRQ